MTRKTRISASSIAAFKACPRRYYYAYHEGIRPVEDTDALRIGTNWHECLEILTMVPHSQCPVCGPLAEPDSKCVLCGGTDVLPDDMMEAVVRHLDKRYSVRPVYIEPIDWDVERIIILYSLAGWRWHYSDDEIETVEREIKFKLPLRNPASGRALPHVKRVGKIDRVIKRGTQYMLGEYKSTSKSLDADSSFWGHLNLVTQISMYALAAREMNLDFEIGDTLYDAWHKPGIRPKKLTQADTKKFLEVCEYCDQPFEIDVQELTSGGWAVEVAGKPATVIMGATPKPTQKNPEPKTPFAIQETPEMYGARLLIDIQERPNYYFARRPIARTDDDLRKFQTELFHIYRTIRHMTKDNAWYMNESQCEATFKCPYACLCYHNVDVSNGQTPDGFRRIYEEKK